MRKFSRFIARTAPITAATRSARSIGARPAPGIIQYMHSYPHTRQTAIFSRFDSFPFAAAVANQASRSAQMPCRRKLRHISPLRRAHKPLPPSEPMKKCIPSPHSRSPRKHNEFSDAKERHDANLSFIPCHFYSPAEA